MKSFLALFLSVAMLSAMSFSVSADNELDTPNDTEIVEEYRYTASLVSTLSISNKTVTCNSMVRGMSNLATKVIVTQTLQKKSGNTWNYVTSWSKTFNSWLAMYSNSKSSLSSGTYRLKTVAKVYSGNSYETITIYSNTASC